MFLRVLWQKYVRSLDNYPVITKAVTGGIFASIGDLISQKLIEKREITDKSRNSVVTSYGFAETILEGQYWFNFLEKVVGKQRTLKHALMKTALDMTLFAPFEIFLFMLWTNVLEQSKTSIFQKLREDFVIVLFNSYVFWVPLTLGCFYVVPIQYRALYMCFVNLVWDTFMSFAAHNPILKKIHIKNNSVESTE